MSRTRIGGLGAVAVTALTIAFPGSAPASAAGRTVPNDSLFPYYWGLEKISAPLAWSTTTGSSSVVIVVADSGIDTTHPDIKPNLWQNPGYRGFNCPSGTYGYDFVDNDCNPYSTAGHGTMVASVAGARGGNNNPNDLRYGLVGVNWNVKILPIRVVDADLQSPPTRVAAALNKVVEAKQAGVNIKVVNASWNNFGYSTEVYNAIKRLGDNGIMLVAAAGNDEKTIVRDTNGRKDPNEYYPCSYSGLSNMICVGASNKSDKLSRGNGTAHTNYGDVVDILAPGQDIVIAIPLLDNYGNTTRGFMTWHGTSFATPHVDGETAQPGQDPEPMLALTPGPDLPIRRGGRGSRGTSADRRDPISVPGRARQRWRPGRGRGARGLGIRGAARGGAVGPERTGRGARHRTGPQRRGCRTHEVVARFPLRVGHAFESGERARGERVAAG